MNTIRKFTLLLFIILLSSASVFSQDKTDKEKLEDLDEYVNKALTDWNVPGVGIAVVKNGKMIFAKGYGYRNLEEKLPVTANTLFSIGSCTKAFTAIDNCILNSEGKINLDKPVINYMPTFKMYDDYVTMNMTPRDLLTHRSGLPRHDLMWYGSDLSRKELFDRLRFLEPSEPFRTTFQYQNLMYMTAGCLVEAVTNDSWENFTKENILIPLEMNSTNFSTLESRKASDFAKPYKIEKNAAKLIDFRDIQSVGPAGSINSNILDMSNWMILHLSNGRFNGEKVVDEEMMQQAHTPYIVVPGPPSKEVSYRSYALGWTVAQYRDHLRLEHGGNIDGFSANVCLLPADSIGIVILTNMDNSVLPSVLRNVFADKMLDLSYIDWNARLLAGTSQDDAIDNVAPEGKDPNQQEDTEPTHELIDYAGKYENEAYGTMKIELKDDNLLMDFHVVKTPLAHYHYDYFKTTSKEFPPMLVNFSLDSKGNVVKVFAQLEQGVKDIEFTKVPDYSNQRSSNLSEYSGEYELDGQVIKITESNNVLTLYIPGQPKYELVPTKNNNFDIKGLKAYSLTFNMDGDKVNEVQFNQPNGTFKAKKK